MKIGQSLSDFAHNYVYLGIALNFSVFQYEIMHNHETAIKLAKVRQWTRIALLIQELITDDVRRGRISSSLRGGLQGRDNYITVVARQHLPLDSRA